MKDLNIRLDDEQLRIGYKLKFSMNELLQIQIRQRKKPSTVEGNSKVNYLKGFYFLNLRV